MLAISIDPEQRTTALRLACLTLSAAALAYAAFDQGGRTSIGWNISLLILGIAAVLYSLAAPRAQRPPFPGPLLAWALLLPPAYVAFQLLPLPLPLLSILSPARANLALSLTPVTQTPSFAPITIHPATTAAYLLRTLAYSLTALLISEISGNTSRRRSWAQVIPLIGIAAMEACLGIFQFTNSGEVSGTYRSRDHFAGLLEMVLPLAVAYGISLLKDSNHPESAHAPETLPLFNAVKACAAFTFAAAMLAGLVYSLSKMGFAAGLAGLFTLAALAVLSKLPGTARWLVAAGLAVSFILVFIFLPTDQLAAAYGSFLAGDPASAEGRAPIWQDAQNLLRAYPAFGTGLGTYGTAFLKYQTANLDLTFAFAHNDYLELFSELGAAGFIIFAALFLIAAVKAVKAAWSEDWNTRILGLGLTGALTAIGIHSLVDFNLYIPANALLLSWLAGVAVGINPGPFPARPPFRILPLLCGSMLIVYAAAWLVFETKYKDDPLAESAFCRFGICGSTTAFADDTPEIPNSPNTTAKIYLPTLLEAVRSDPAAPHRWCDLGDSFLQANHLQQARYCYSNALALGPEIPPILARSAAFYHALHDDRQSLKQGAQVIEKSDIYRPGILEWYYDQKFNITDVLCLGMPPSPLGVQAYLHYWMGHGDLTNAQTTWNWMISRQQTNLPIARDYIKFLFANARYPEAAATWSHFLAGQGMGDRQNVYRKSNWLYNGDFELENSGVPFDWEISSIPGQVETQIDQTMAYSGTHSLRIRFTGTENVNYTNTTQMASVPPGTYRFTAFIRTQDITTDKGIAFHIFGPGLDVKTNQFAGTTGWTKVEQTIRVTPTTKLLTIQVIREATMKFDNKISGTAWIDQVSLIK